MTLVDATFRLSRKDRDESVYHPEESHLQNQTSNIKPWRCHACGALLGIARGDELHVKYRDAEIWIAGPCRSICRRCGKSNEITVGRPSKEDR
jgi:hypothetical protein